jgi:hypothetical protein
MELGIRRESGFAEDVFQRTEPDVEHGVCGRRSLAGARGRSGGETIFLARSVGCGLGEGREVVMVGSKCYGRVLPL